jgi:hypothetical protein
MSKFNATSEIPVVENYMGAPAVKYKPEMELLTIILTSFVEDSYYEKAPDMLKRLKKVISKCDKEFVSKAAVYARTVFGMRSITHVVASILGKYLSGNKIASAFYDKVINRPDDITEIVAYHLKNGEKVSNAMKKGFGSAIGRFNEYSLAKYKGGSKEVKMVDVVNMIHPKPTELNKEPLNKLVNDKLISSGTWESELSAAGQNANSEEEKIANKKEVWEKLINEGSIGIFAVLRNLRNIMEQAPASIPKAIDILTDPKRIKKSLILPFRYLTAYRVIEELPDGIFEKDTSQKAEVLKGIEKAVTTSIDNLPTLMGKTMILVDNSGSMSGDGGGGSPVSAMSKTTTADIANLFAVMYWLKADDTFVGLFGDKLVVPKMKRDEGLFNNFKFINSAAKQCGASTEAGVYTMFQKMVNEKIMVDTVVIFSDCQIGTGCSWYGVGGIYERNFMKLFSEYKKINPGFRCYSIDLKGYGTTVFDGSVIKISGWSEKIFDIMKFAEQDKNALINEIKKISFDGR